MNHISILISTILILCLVTQNCFAQDKFEEESRIKSEEVPEAARTFIDEIHVDKKVRWYCETGLDSKSIEAKFKKNKTRYSIEFDTTGIIQDAELEICWEDLAPLIRANISAELGEICAKYKTRKIQIQYTGEENDLLLCLAEKGPTEKLTTKYELIVKCKNKYKVDLFEYLFSEEGKLLASSKIVFKNSSNLEY
jgi:hypothetical protein